ncbi:MAG: hypothetical protein PHI50_03695 [Alphaproteobacteria bacterium]|nr:hypothetical protein [Alphaproteobacteria bacterium]
MKKYSYAFMLLSILSLQGCLLFETKEEAMPYKGTFSENYLTPLEKIDKGADISLDVKTTESADELNLEAPFRCQAGFQGLDEIISAVPVKKGELKLSLFTNTDPLPRYEVNGFTFKDLTLDRAFQRLVLEADISVFDKDFSQGEFSGKNIRGELSNVLDSLSQKAGMYWTYNARLKRIDLMRRAQFEINVPGNRAVVFALLDALRGAGIEKAVADWHKNKIIVTLTRDSQKVVEKLLSDLKKNPELFIYDIKVYRAYPEKKGKKLDWQKVVENFGLKKVNMAVDGVIGRLLITSYENGLEDIPELVSKTSSIMLASQGFVVAPEGWKVRFDVGRCGRLEGRDAELSILFNPRLKKDRRIENTVSLDSLSGEISSYKIVSSIGDNFMIIGLPLRLFNKQEKEAEYVITVNSRVIRLVMDGVK